jgi:hypothetical protein
LPEEGELEKTEKRSSSVQSLAKPASPSGHCSRMLLENFSRAATGDPDLRLTKPGLLPSRGEALLFFGKHRVQ